MWRNYKKRPKQQDVSALSEKLAATYSRGVYKTTTIGKTVFDGRVRNGNGSDHSFMATKNRTLERESVEAWQRLPAPSHHPTKSKSNAGFGIL